MNNLIYKDRNTKQLKTLNLNQLAYLLQISTTELMIRLSRQVAKIGNLFEDNKGQIARAIFLRTLNSATETQALIGNQVQILSHAQGNRYVPFLTSELNKALANLIASHKPLTDLLKLFVGNTQTLPQSSADGTSEIPKNTGAYLTTDTAIKLLGESNSSIIYDSNELDAAQGRLGELPEVRANYQGGDWAKAPEYLTDGTVETLTQDAKRISREERREQRRQIGEVLDDDDFVA